MGSNNDTISGRILSEVDALKAPKAVKRFLKEILDYEIEILGEGKPQYVDTYKAKIDEILDLKEEE